MSSCGKKAVILLSGGVDSVTALYWAKSKGYEITALIFDYNQKHKKELDCAKKICSLNKIKYLLIKTEFPWAESSLTDRKIKVPYNRKMNDGEIPVTYVSGRNIIFLSYAFSLAESFRAEDVFIGAHVQDYSGYPDCRPEFLKYFQKAANSGMKNGRIKVKAPLISKSKKEIVKLGIKLGVPFQYTWSCYEGGASLCGKCDSCRFREIAFQELGLTDPLINKK